MFGSGTKTLIISNEEMNDIMKIVMSLGESLLLIHSVSKTIKNKAKEEKREFLKQARIFNATSSFNKFGNTKVLSK